MAPYVRWKKCLMENCGNDNRQYPDLTFFLFPKGNYKWIAACGDATLKMHKRSKLPERAYVCSEHFCDSDYRFMLSPFRSARKLLKSSAVPKRAVQDKGDGQPEVEEPTGGEDLEKCSGEYSKLPKKTKKRIKKCASVNCDNDSQSHPEIKFYKFPHSNYKEWIAASGCPKLNTLTKINLCSNYYVCSNHFTLTDCKKILPPFKTDVSLKRGVVPVPFNYGDPRIEAGQSDAQSSPEKVKTSRPASKKSKTSQPASKKSKTSQPSTKPSVCLPDVSAINQTAAESTSRTSLSKSNMSYQNFSIEYGDYSSINNSAAAFLRNVQRENCEQTHSNLRHDQIQGTALCLIQEPKNNQIFDCSLPCLAPKKPTLTPLLSDVDYEKSCSKVATVSDGELDEFVGGEEICFESFVDDGENQLYIDDDSYDQNDARVIEKKTYSCSKQGSESEASSKDEVQMHNGSEFERDELKVASDVSVNVCNENCSVPNPSLCNKEGTSSSLASKVIEDKSVNFKDSTVGGSIVSSTSSGGAVEERGSEKLDIIVTAGVKAGLTNNSVVSAASTIGEGCTTVAKVNRGSLLLSASPIATEVQLFLRLPDGQTIPVKVPVAALMSASTTPSPSPLCLPPPVQQVVELPQQASSTQLVSDVSPASDPLASHQPGPLPAASGSDAPEGPTSDCSSEPQKGKKRKKCVLESPSEDDEETKKMKDLGRKRVATEKRRLSRQKQRERELKNAPEIAELASVNSKLASEMALLKAEVTSLKDVLLQHMSCLTVRGTNSSMVAAANPFVGATPVVVAAEGPKVAGANPFVVAAEGPKVAAANPVVVAAEGLKVAAANPVVVAAEGLKVAAANPVVVAAEGPKVARATPVVVPTAKCGVVAAEGSKVAAVPAVHSGQSSDAVRQLMPHSTIIWPFTIKPTPAAYQVFKLIPISKI